MSAATAIYYLGIGPYLGPALIDHLWANALIQITYFVTIFCVWQFAVVPYLTKLDENKTRVVTRE